MLPTATMAGRVVLSLLTSYKHHSIAPEQLYTIATNFGNLKKLLNNLTTLRTEEKKKMFNFVSAHKR